MNIRPLYDRIVVKRIEEQETTRNGIVIPDSAKEKPQEGEVMAVGHGKTAGGRHSWLPSTSKPATASCLGSIPAARRSWMGTEYIIMREDDVLGVLDAAAQALPKAS